MTIRVYEADNHLFFLGAGRSSLGKYEAAQHVDPAAITDWLARTARTLSKDTDMTEEQEFNDGGHEQFLPPHVPPGMHFDRGSKLTLPQGVQLASRAQVAAALLLGLLLSGVTLGIGYIIWSLFTWSQGRTPAQRILNLRCWLPEPRRVANRDDMAVRQVLGFFLCGGLLWGFFVWLVSNSQRSAGDLLAGTVVLHDPDGVLALPSAASSGTHPPAASRARVSWAAAQALGTRIPDQEPTSR